MRVMRDAVIIGFIVRGALWVLDHKGDVLTIVALAVSAYLAVRFLIWFGRGLAQGFVRAWRREFGKGDIEAAERRELVERLAADMREVSARGTGYSPR